MIVVCKTASNRIIKGHRYEVVGLYNKVGSYGKVYIKNLGPYSVNSFTTIDGDELPNIEIKRHITIRTTFEELSKGDILVCESDRYKTFIKNGMYEVQELFTKTVIKIRKWNNHKYQITTNYIKFVGISRKIKFNSWAFRKLNPQETREISLNSILDGKKINIIKTSKFRKIDMVENKDAELIKNLAKSILDTNRHHLSVIDWASEKTGSQMGIKPSDYDDIINLTLKEIIEKI